MTNAASISEKYPVSDVHNVNESGLFYEMLLAIVLDLKGKRATEASRAKSASPFCSVQI